MKILVCDDLKHRARQTGQLIRDASGHDVELLSAAPLTEEINALMARAREALGDAHQPASATIQSRFGGAFDLVILDNNLSDLKVVGARAAEAITGYFRAFVDIPYIVSLNKNPNVDFDLRYLLGDYRTHADIALNSRHLANAALWSGNPADSKDGFLPWYWPALNRAVSQRRDQIRFVSDHLDRSILKSMEFPPFASDYLSRHAKGALSPDAAHATRITFKKFFDRGCQSLEIEADRKRISNAASENPSAREVVARIVAAELDRWIRRDLLGPQDLLVDVPHLLMRMPFLVSDDAQSLRNWNSAVTASAPPYGLSASIYREHLEQAQFPRREWTRSPCFWWPALKSNPVLKEMYFRTDTSWTNALFCEDISQFRLSDDDTHGAPIEFAAEFEGTWNRRHVAQMSGKQYSPRSRFAI
ncbi:MAG: hypothetical protein F4Y71_07005 [Acidobacteria bacterium]|nr:hypothetical protein [Acidobacteriota bacterium]MYG74200.1 hypothetical protein [Acidobacteriota bacterium]